MPHRNRGLDADGSVVFWNEMPTRSREIHLDESCLYAQIVMRRTSRSNRSADRVESIGSDFRRSWNRRGEGGEKSHVRVDWRLQASDVSSKGTIGRRWTASKLGLSRLNLDDWTTPRLRVSPRDRYSAGMHDIHCSITLSNWKRVETSRPRC